MQKTLFAASITALMPSWKAKARLIGLSSIVSPADVYGADNKDASRYDGIPPIWTGFYVGANMGAGFGVHALTNGQSSSGGADVPDDGVMVGAGNSTGILGGGQVGYNYQMGQFVFGLEGEIDASGVGGHTMLHPRGASGDFDNSTDWVAMTTGRIGAVFHGDTLFYLKAGLAWDENTYKLSVTSPFESGTYPSLTDSRIGWVLGFGAEYEIAPQWTAKAEYDYIDFGTQTVSFPRGTGSVDVVGAFTTDIDQKLHVVKVGVSHKLGFADYDSLK
jgi:outer membrane immunogenic protein